MDRLNDLVDKQVEPAPKPVIAAPKQPAEPAEPNDRDVRLEIAERMAREAENRAIALREQIVSLIATGNAKDDELVRLHQAQHTAIEQAAVSHQIAGDLR